MRALIFVRETGAIDNSAYRGMMHVDTLAASKSLRHLKSLGLLEDRGSGSRTHYVPGPSLSDFLSDDASMHVKVESIITKTEDSPTKTRDLPPGLQARVVSMPKRLPPERAEKMIVDLCAWKPLSAEELAGILGKTTNYLSNKYLYQMVRDGKLHYLYPKMVKHPGQKYKVEAND